MTTRGTTQALPMPPTRVPPGPLPALGLPCAQVVRTLTPLMVRILLQPVPCLEGGGRVGSWAGGKGIKVVRIGPLESGALARRT